MNEAIDKVAIALEEFTKGKTDTPIRAAIPIKKEQATALFMPSYVDSENSIGIKFVSVYPNNKNSGKKTIYGVMMLADAHTGEPLAFMDASYLTMLRTGAASGLATKLLARKNSKKLTVIGTGVQAEGIINAILAVRPIEEIILNNRSSEKAEDLKNRLSDFYGHIVIKVIQNSNEAVADADIVVTATNSLNPVLSGETIKEGTHINAIGSFRPNMQELPTFLMKRANKIVVEARDAALEESGDLFIPIHEGELTYDDIYAELGEISLNRKAGREDDKEITIFKSVGLATMDVVIAKAVYDQAISLQLGVEVHL